MFVWLYFLSSEVEFKGEFLTHSFWWWGPCQWLHFQVLSVINAKDDTRPWWRVEMQGRFLERWRKVVPKTWLSQIRSKPTRFHLVKPPFHKLNSYKCMCFAGDIFWDEYFGCVIAYCLCVFSIGSASQGVSTSPSFAHAMHVHIVSPRARCAEVMVSRMEKVQINQNPWYLPLLGPNISCSSWVCLKMIFLCGYTLVFVGGYSAH